MIREDRTLKSEELQKRITGSSRSTRWPTPQQVLAAAHAAAVEQQQQLYGLMQRNEDGRATAMGGERRNRQRPVR